MGLGERGGKERLGEKGVETAVRMQCMRKTKIKKSILMMKWQFYFYDRDRVISSFLISSMFFH